ncbi:hypothetical protein BJ165DRAFT_1406167 [Panaeolus papilionaceus]|nr:hypothetical protein BJ165DRAFT_1406167 [Panaeolus papilionaceus]
MCWRDSALNLGQAEVVAHRHCHDHVLLPNVPTPSTAPNYLQQQLLSSKPVSVSTSSMNTLLAEPIEGIHGYNCTNCGQFISFKPCQSKVNGNYGRLVATCQGVNAEGRPCNFICWCPWSHPTQTMELPVSDSHLPSPLPPLSTQPVPSQPQQVPVTIQLPTKRTCVFLGCGQMHLADDCQRRACWKHCVTQGGCPVKNHQGDVKGKGKVIDNVAHLFPSFHPSSSQQPTPSLSSSSLTMPPLLSSSQPVLSLASQAPSPPSQATNLCSPPVTPIDVVHASHIKLIFTEQMATEYKLHEAKRKEDKAQLDLEKHVAQTVWVTAWTINLPEPVERKFQGGFIWPNFELTANVLELVGLAGVAETGRLQVFDVERGDGKFVYVGLGYSVDVRITGPQVVLHDARVDVVDVNTSLAKNSPHLRYNLPVQRSAVACTPLRSSAQTPFSWLNGLPSPPALASPFPASSSGHRSSPPWSQASPSSSPWASVTSVTPLSSSSGVSESPLPMVSSPSSPVVMAESDNDIEIIDVQGTHPQPSTAIAPSMATMTGNNSDDDDDSDDDIEVSSLHPIPHTILPRHSARQWPNDYYVCDIAEFFISARTTVRRDHTTRGAQLFKIHFPRTTYHCSTYYSKKKVWRLAPQHLKEEYIEAGRTSKGLWSSFALWLRQP